MRDEKQCDGLPARANPGCHDASPEHLSTSETGHGSGAYDLGARAFLVLGSGLVSAGIEQHHASPRLEVGSR